MKKFPGHLALQQRVLPIYRVPFFEALADSCEGGLSIFAGEPRPEENIVTAKTLRNTQYAIQKNLHLLKGSLYFCHQPKLLNWLEKTDPDVLILEANPRYLATPTAIKWMRVRKRPVIGWGLGAPPRSGFLAGLQEKNWIRFLNKFSALIAYSQRGADDYASYGIPREKIFVAHNAVAPKPKGEMLERPARKNAGEPFILLFVGRLQVRKKIDSLIRACAALPALQNIQLWIVGEGAIRFDLEKLAQEIFPNTRFFGERHGAELAHIWAEADLFALPGTGGLAVQEAMAHALPVIVAKGDGTQDDLVRPSSGWQIPPDDLGALTKILTRAVADLSRLRKMGAESWRIVAEEVNVEKMVETFIEVLEATKPF